MDHQLSDQRNNRIPLACETCRRRKRKCDGGSPCLWCLKNQLECIYQTERKRKRRLDSRYTTSLEEENLLLKDYIRQLERITGASFRSAHISELLTDYSDEPEESESPPSPDLGQSDNQETSELRVIDGEAAIDDISSMIWKMSISDDGISSFVGPSGNFCIPSARSNSSVPSTVQFAQPMHNPASMTAVVGPDSSVPFPQETPESVTALLTLFAHHINSVHCFLDDDILSVLVSVSQSKPNYSLLRNAVLAAAALLSDDPAIREQGSSSYAEAAAADALRCSRDYPSTTTIQALAILCWRELGLENENEAWLYNAMCVSLCVHLGLHVSSLENVRQTMVSSNTSGGVMDRSNQIHIQNRAFWSSFSMDRIATSIMGRNCMLPLSRLDAIPLLKSVGPNPSPGNIVFHYHTKAWLLHDRWMDSIYCFHFNKLPQFKRLQLLLDARDELNSFMRKLPSEASLSQKELTQDVVILHMIHHMSCLLIHRPYLKEPPSNAARFLASKISIEAASQMVTLIKYFPKAKVFRSSSSILGGGDKTTDTANWRKAPFVVIHCILTAAISLLLNVASSSFNQSTRGQLVSRFRVCFAALVSMGPRWLRARRAVVLLKQLAQRWNAVSALPIEHSSPLGPEDVLVLETTGNTLGRRRSTTNEIPPHRENDQTRYDPWPGWLDLGRGAADTYGLEFFSTLNPNEVDEPFEWNFDKLSNSQQ